MSEQSADLQQYQEVNNKMDIDACFRYLQDILNDSSLVVAKDEVNAKKAAGDEAAFYKIGKQGKLSYFGKDYDVTVYAHGGYNPSTEWEGYGLHVKDGENTVIDIPFIVDKNGKTQTTVDSSQRVSGLSVAKGMLSRLDADKENLMKEFSDIGAREVDEREPLPLDQPRDRDMSLDLAQTGELHTFSLPRNPDRNQSVINISDPAREAWLRFAGTFEEKTEDVELSPMINLNDIPTWGNQILSNPLEIDQDISSLITPEGYNDRLIMVNSALSRRDEPLHVEIPQRDNAQIENPRVDDKNIPGWDPDTGKRIVPNYISPPGAEPVLPPDSTPNWMKDDSSKDADQHSDETFWP
jgi:hypothetical protein